ncbi:hypothetical protein GCM10027285_18390 [Oleiagrimonas citrea]|uniref:TlpA family protein disulfide reductase n=1 Tax=Oleiagrimonas citrea TaxID=1665687 RepID=A0A846ZJT4_9GAMM|nr:TlpA disulfide reductase family protein [Oleiagrimonas citrea]NKZ37843.1 TlpA family protein disulfide reductase [Oleiagrimonas citrea]
MKHPRLRTVLAMLLVLVAASAHAALKSGDKVPDYLGNKVDGTAIHSSQYRGKVLVVTFWATWCHYCMHELPVLANIQRLTGDRLQVVAISHDETRRTYLYVHRKLHKLGMVLAYDRVNKAAHAFGVNGIPHMVIIGPDGHIAHVHVGYDKDMLPTIASELNTLLAEVPHSGTVTREEPPRQAR